MDPASSLVVATFAATPVPSRADDGGPALEGPAGDGLLDFIFVFSFTRCIKYVDFGQNLCSLVVN